MHHCTGNSRAIKEKRPFLKTDIIPMAFKLEGGINGLAISGGNFFAASLRNSGYFHYINWL